MNQRSHRDLLGPSWPEVILGAVLSFVLGIVLAAGFLIAKPVSVVKEAPKEPVPDQVYFVAGTSDASKARQVSAKEKAFVQGGSVVLSEDELNVLTAPEATVQKDSAAPARSGFGKPNFRIRNSVLQVAMPMKISAAGLNHEILVQARGGFEKQGEVFVFVPSELYVGSCPVQRLPGVPALVLRRMFGALGASEEVAAAWRRLSEVAVEGSTLRLTME